MITKVFIIEDEQYIRDELYFLLDKRKDITVVGHCATVKEALIILPNIKVDLVLMDIQLEDGKSFEIIENLPAINFNIIFITAYNNYAIKAIKAGAIDYLLKPIDVDELYAALDTFASLKQKKFDIRQKELLLHHTKFNKPLKNIVVKTVDKIYFITLSDIIYCQGQGNYTTLFVKDNLQLISSKPLKDYASLLDNDDFIKTHQSYLVNKNYVSYYDSNGELVLEDGDRIPVSMRRRDLVIKSLTQR